MIGDDKVLIWAPGEIDDGEVPAAHLPYVREILAWVRRYLVSPHPELGRNGPVCPYTQPSLHRGLLYLASLADLGGADVSEAVGGLRLWYERLLATVSGTADQELLTILLVLPQLDFHDATELDEVQRQAKDRFVAEGLMIGQFHPVCAAPGLWNPDFKALRAPVPLLAVRKLLVFDMPFLMDTGVHAESYFRRFAPDIPPRIRDQLVSRLAGVSAPISEVTTRL